jgi:UPF0716 protein FxsA
MGLIVEPVPSVEQTPTVCTLEGRMAILLLLFIVVPIVEIYVIIQVGQAIGALWTILLLIADSLVGARLLRWQGRTAWRRFQEALAAGRMPHREILDGVMVVVGGTLLLTPGFITDVAGLLLLVPPTRAFLRRMIVRSLQRRGTFARVVIRTASGRRPEPPEPASSGRQLPKG